MDRDVKFAIRNGSHEDIGAMVDLYAQATRLMAELSPVGFGRRLAEPQDLKKEKENFSKALADENTVILVAETNCNLAGFVMGVIEDHPDDLLDSPYLTVQYICVNERYRRQGIGRRLMTEAEDWAKDRGITTLDLMVWNGNEPARRLFDQMGYVPLDIRMGKRISD